LKHLVLAAFLAFGLVLHASDKSAMAVKPAQVVIPQSAFTDDPRLGKDPFFPNSTRRQATTSTYVAPTNAAPTSSLFGFLALKGISGTKAQPLALINGTTVAAGETAEIRSGLQIIKIRCLEIRERSALIELAGSKDIREIKLRDGF
jgi:hypothetical protein